MLVPVERRYTYDRTRAASPRSSPARSRARTAASYDRVDEGEAPGRPDRLQPERRGQDDRVGLLGAPASAGAPVSTPLRWDEVNESLDPASFTMDAVAGAGRAARRPLRGRATTTSSRSSPRCARSSAEPLLVRQSRDVKLDALVRELDAYFRVPHVRDDDWSRPLRGRLPRAVLARLRRAGLRGPLERADGARRRRGRAGRHLRLPERPDRRRARAAHAALLRASARLRRRARLPAARARELRGACASAAISFYHAHAPLDMHPEVSPSRLCAEGVGLEPAGGVLPDRRGDSRAAPRSSATAGSPSRVSPRRSARSSGPRSRCTCSRGRGSRRGGWRSWPAAAPTPTILEASLERGCETYVTGNAATNCRLDFVQEEVRELPRARRRGRRRAHRRDALRHGEAAAARRWSPGSGGGALQAEFVPDGPK